MIDLGDADRAAVVAAVRQAAGGVRILPGDRARGAGGGGGRGSVDGARIPRGGRRRGQRQAQALLAQAGEGGQVLLQLQHVPVARGQLALARHALPLHGG